MKKGLLLLADGFEQTEAIATHDILLRSHGIEVLPVSISSSYEVTSSMGLKILVSKRLEDIKDVSAYDFIVLPGGKVGVPTPSHRFLVGLIHAMENRPRA